MTVHIYNENTHGRNEWGEEGNTKETPMEESVGGKKSLLWLRDDVFILIYMTLMKSWNHIQDDVFILVYNTLMKSRNPI